MHKFRVIHGSRRIFIKRDKPKEPLVDRPIRWRRKIFHFDEGEKIRAIKQAANLRDKRAVPVLIELLKQSVCDGKKAITDTDGELLEETIAALSQIGISEKHITESINILKTGSRDERRAAAMILGTSKNATALPALIEALKDHNIFIKIEAVNALKAFAKEGIDCSSALDQLFQILVKPIETKLADPLINDWVELHLEIISLLGEIKGKDAVLMLKMMLRKHDERVLAAHKALSKLGLTGEETELSEIETRELLNKFAVARLAEYGLDDDRTKQEVRAVVDFILEHVTPSLLQKEIEDAVDSIERYALRNLRNRSKVVTA